MYTEPNPNIKYEYFTESLPGDLEVESITKSTRHDVPQTGTTKHIRRHHGYDVSPQLDLNTKHPDVTGLFKEGSSSESNLVENVVGGRRFVWKITSYTQCSRTCGGGIQVRGWVSAKQTEVADFWQC